VATIGDAQRYDFKNTKIEFHSSGTTEGRIIGFEEIAGKIDSGFRE